MANSINIKQSVNGIIVSTANKGISYETVCFFGTKMLLNEGFKRQYTSVSDAIKGHQRMIKRVEALTA